MKTTVIFKNPRGYLESTRYLNVASIFLNDEKNIVLVIRPTIYASEVETATFSQKELVQIDFEEEKQ